MFPGARVEPKAGVSGTGGVFVAAPVAGWFGVQGELLVSRRQHSVDLAPFEDMTLSDPSLRVGDPDTNIYADQALAYGAPDLLRPTQTSLAVVAGWTSGRLLVEVRFARGLQSIFKDRDGLVAGFVKAGGHEPTLRRLISEFGPFLESAKSQDLAVLAGVRF